MLNVHYVEIQVINFTIKLDINASKLTENMNQKFPSWSETAPPKKENPSWRELHHQKRKSLMSVMPSCNYTWWWCCFSIELILYHLALWNRMGITVGESVDIERVQRAALHIILGSGYSTYSSALSYFNLETLETRRIHLCEKFSKKAVKHPKHTKWFKINNRTTVTRQEQPKYCPVVAKTRRFQKSPLCYFSSLLNKYSRQEK